VKKFGPGGSWDPDKDKWELYHLDEDFSEANDLAAKEPEKLAELKKLFWEEAEKYHVTPLMGGLAPFFGLVHPSVHRTKFAYYSGTENVLPGMMPQIFNRSFTITADLELPKDGADGVIVAEGDAMGGFALYIENGKLHYTYGLVGIRLDTLTSSEKVPTGRVTVRYEFTPEKPGKPGTGGKGQLFISDKVSLPRKRGKPCAKRAMWIRTSFAWRWPQTLSASGVFRLSSRWSWAPSLTGVRCGRIMRIIFWSLVSTGTCRRS
jgi:arylsulfatase